MKIVLANGVFDILHDGHLSHLEEAKRMGDILVVSVTADAWVHKGPGRPVNDMHKRMRHLRALRCVDAVVPTISAISAIRQVKPHVFIKGIDYAGGNNFSEGVVEVCNELGIQIAYTTSPKTSATEIIRKTLAA